MGFIIVDQNGDKVVHFVYTSRKGAQNRIDRMTQTQGYTVAEVNATPTQGVRA